MKGLHLACELAGGALVAAWLGLPATAAGWGSPTHDVDAHTYRSPGGRAALFVDPVDRHSRKGADYVAIRDGKVLWRGRRTYARYKAVIADNGTVGGCYFQRREDLPRKDGSPYSFELHVVVLSPDGTVRLDQATPVVESRIPDEDDYPEPIDLFQQPEADRMVLRVQAPDLSPRGEQWWPFRLSTGAALPHQEPEMLAPGTCAGRIAAVRPVRGTPLILIHRRRSASVMDDGAHFSLVDTECRTVWQLDLPHDYEHLGDAKTQRERANSVVRSGIILDAAGAGHFALRFVQAHKRVEFVVRKAATGEWKVRELSRLPWPPPAHAKALPERTLRRLGTVSLREPDQLGSVRAVSVGGDDRIYATDARTGEVHVFDADGRKLQVFPARPALKGARFEAPEASAGRRGDIVIGPYADGSSQRFSRDGRLLEMLPAIQDEDLLGLSGERWLLAPGGEARWAISDQLIRRVDTKSGRTRRISRRPDRTWLQGISAAVVAETGMLGVLERAGSGNPRVSLFSPAGDPVRRLDISAGADRQFSLAIGRGRIFLGGPKGLVVTNLWGRHLWRARPPVASTEQNIDWQVFLARARRELWWYDGVRTVYRTALPDEPVASPHNARNAGVSGITGKRKPRRTVQ